MKQGNTINRIVMLVLFAAVMLYLAVSAVNSFTDRTTTVVSYAYTLDDSAEATGFVVREEYVLPAQSGLADVLPAEGEKVAVGGTVAYLYRDAAALERKQEIRALNLQIEQLTYSLSRNDDRSDNAQLTEEIMENLVELKAAVAGRDFTSLEDDAMELKNLVFKRDYSYEGGGDLSGIQANIEALKSRVNELQAASAADTTAVTVNRSGVYSGLVDGYEEVLTPGMLNDLTPAKLDALAGRTPSAQAGAVGKLITDSRWYFVCALSEADAKRLVEGNQVTIRFSRDWSGDVSMLVEHIGAVENGRCAVVLSSTHYLSETTLLRRQTVDIIFSSITGIRVPKNALYQDEAGQWGVYVMVSAQAEYKPVAIVGDDEDYYLVKALNPATDLDKDVAKRALRPGDEIILTAEDLYDGKVIRK